MRLRFTAVLSVFTMAILLTAVSTNGLAKKKGKTLKSADLKGQTVLLKNISVSTKANTLSREDVRKFAHKTLPKLIVFFDNSLKRKYKADLDESGFNVDGTGETRGIVIKEKGGVVKATWEDPGDAPYTASMKMTLDSVKGMVMVYGIVKKKDPREKGKPFKKLVIFGYIIK